jgi:murein L,D-transpeptidase YcbB/YkuD
MAEFRESMKRRLKSIWVPLVFVLLGVLAWMQPLSDDFSDTLSSQVVSQLQNQVIPAGLPPGMKVSGEWIMRLADVKRFYEGRYYQAAWIDKSGNPIHAPDLLKVLQTADQEGMKPGNYHLETIADLLDDVQDDLQENNRPPSETLAALDLLLTDAFCLYAVQAARGCVDNRHFESVKLEVKPEFDVPEFLEESLATGRVAEALAGLQPCQAGYRGLKEALANVRALNATMSWKAIAVSRTLKKGDRDPVLSQIRLRLKAWGDLGDLGAGDPDFLDDSLEQALLNYQERNTLPETGEVDSATMVSLNVPWEDRIRTMELNLERWRWMPRDLGSRYILVNTPAFRLDFVQNNHTRLSMRVVVGQKYYWTPMFSDKLRTIVLNPVWEIPPDIVVRDKLAAIRHEPDFFTKHHINVLEGWEKDTRVVDPKTVNWKKVKILAFYDRYRLVQASDASNPLGRIKFVFPNDFNVYLHDTPKHELFEKDIRDFSSGCIRLEKPVDLAAEVLRGHRFWSRERIEGAIQCNIEQKIRLTKALPVHILYWTAWVDDEHRIHFCQDLYGRDKNLSLLLNKEPAPQP